MHVALVIFSSSSTQLFSPTTNDYFSINNEAVGKYIAVPANWIVKVTRNDEILLNTMGTTHFDHLDFGQ